MNVDNKLIAEFLGYSQPHPDYPDTTYWYKKDFPPLTILSFDTDWNWLIQVVEKIESLGYRTLTENECFMITKNKLSSFDVRSKDDYSTIFSDNYEINHYGGSKKENVYNACVEFIKWYNEQPK
jgi:hypothetical protein